MKATVVLHKEAYENIDNAGSKPKRKVKPTVKKGDTDWWDELPEKIQNSVEKSLRESEEGKGISHEQILEKYSKWFKK